MEPTPLVKHAVALDQLDRLDLVVLADDAGRSPAGVQPDPFPLGLLDFLAGGRDLVEVFQAIHLDCRGAFTDRFARHIQRHPQIRRCLLLFLLLYGRRCCRRAAMTHHRARHIKRDVAATNHHHLAPHRHAVTEVDVEKKINRPQHPVVLHAFDRQFAALVRADREKDRLEPFLLEIGQQEIAAQPLVVADLDPERLDRPDLRRHDLARQPVFRHAEHQHPAGHGLGLEHGRREPQQRQFMGAGQPGRSGTDHGDLAAATETVPLPVPPGGVDAAQIKVVGLRTVPFTDKPFQGADRHRGIKSPAPALGFAGGGADAATDRGERVRGTGDDIGILVPALGDGLHVATGIGMNRACLLAGHQPREILRARQFHRIAHGAL